MDWHTMDLNTPVEIAVGVTKPLGDCTVEDLTASAEILEAKAIRGFAAADNFRKGQAPKCDWQGQDGHYCENDSEYVFTGIAADGSEVPRSLCAKHAKGHV